MLFLTPGPAGANNAQGLRCASLFFIFFYAPGLLLAWRARKLPLCALKWLAHTHARR